MTTIQLCFGIVPQPPVIFMSPSEAERYWLQLHENGYRYDSEGGVLSVDAAKRAQYLSHPGAVMSARRWVTEVTAPTHKEAV